MLPTSLRVFLFAIMALLSVVTDARAAASNALTSVVARGPVGPGDSALCASFTIEGSAPKSVLVRAIGPTLATFGITGVLTNPVATVYDGSGVVVASNDDWGGTAALNTAFANVGAFPLSSSSKDAALLATLSPGTYTVRVTGAGGTTGVALAEVYENDSVSRFAYVSARHYVGTGPDILVAGFFVTGPSSQTVLVRGLGPALGISGALANPTLRVFGSNGQLIATNDDWNGADVAAAATSAGLMPLSAGSRDSALLVTLAPGSYSVQLSGVGATTGIGACEIALVNGRAGTLTPALVTVPDAVSASSGSSLTLGAPFVGNPTPSMQWRKNGVPIANATNAAFTLPSVDAASVGSYSVVLSSSAGAVTSQPWVVTTSGSVSTPSITAQPANADVSFGETAFFSVNAIGAGPLSFQWSKNGVPIPTGISALYGVQNFAESSTLTVFNVDAQSAGTYRVTVSSPAGSVTSRDATLTAGPRRVAPAVLNQPSDVVVTVGDSTQLQVVATGSPAPAYQWFREGGPVTGATSSTFLIPSARPADAGGYFVMVTNSAGSVMSRTATVTVSSTPLAPTITGQPNTVAVVPGSRAEFAVTATGTSVLRYQWSKDGAALPDQTRATLIIPAASFEDVGSYSVTVSNTVGSATSATVSLSTLGRYGSAAYFGSLGAGGTFALFVTDTNSGYFLGRHAASGTTIVNRAVAIGSDGSFSFSSGPAATISGRIAGDGSVSGILSGANLTVAGLRAVGSNSAQAVAGFYQAGQVNGSGITYTIVATTGKTYTLTVTPAGADAGLGTTTGSGSVSVVTAGNTTLTGTLNPSASTMTATVTPAGGQGSEFIGGSASRPVLEKLLNISTRARVGVGGDVLIAGFVISGTVPKQILVRAIGPGLGAFGVTGGLATPRLEVASGSGTLAANTGWSTSPDAAAIASVTERVGGFALAPGSADSALLLTLPPGGYTAIVSGAAGATGVALVEVYDVSDNAIPGQKVVNLSARAIAGAGNDSLIAGYNISGTLPKRVLVRAVGPALASTFGVTGALADPQLRIVRASDGATVASNDNWGDSAASELAAAAVAVGAFAFAENSRDAALLINLPPGSYSAVITGAGTSSGVALVEVYEVP